eukprot:1472536-Prymnesium_polylepis.1
MTSLYPFGAPSSLMRSSSVPSAVSMAPACSKYLRLAVPSSALDRLVGNSNGLLPYSPAV